MTIKFTNGCKAYRQNDQIVCPVCGIAWDLDESESFKCQANEPRPRNKKREILKLKRAINDESN